MESEDQREMLVSLVRQEETALQDEQVPLDPLVHLELWLKVRRFLVQPDLLEWTEPLVCLAFLEQKENVVQVENRDSAGNQDYLGNEDLLVLLGRKVGKVTEDCLGRLEIRGRSVSLERWDHLVYKELLV